MTFADVLLRAKATDIESEVSAVYRIHGYGVSMSPFDEQPETIIVTMPELNIARTAVLDYWPDLDIRPEKHVFNFNTSLRPDEATTSFFRAVCHAGKEKKKSSLEILEEKFKAAQAERGARHAFKKVGHLLCFPPNPSAYAEMRWGHVSALPPSGPPFRLTSSHIVDRAHLGCSNRQNWRLHFGVFGSASDFKWSRER